MHDLIQKSRAALSSRPIHRLASTKLHRAAVLLPIVTNGSGPHILFTVRTDTVEHHKGQISFPGGGVDSAEESLLDTAFRETAEEVGVARSQIEILGRLDDQPTPSGFCISPFVGILRDGAQPCIKSEIEIKELFTAPLGSLLEPSIYREDPPVNIDFFGAYQTFTIPHFQFGPHDIWGATGRILCQFFSEVLGWQPTPAT